MVNFQQIAIVKIDGFAQECLVLEKPYTLYHTDLSLQFSVNTE